jgi:sarcosine oxidase subunit gamma
MFKTLIDPCSIIRLQSWDCEIPAPSKIEQVLGSAWPNETGVAASGRVDILCVGPTDWLVIDTHPETGALLQQLAEAFEGSAFRATNVSSALARIEIEGPEARVLLSKGCALDLHPPCFPPGRCARTRLAGMPVIVRCTRASTFECIIASSYRDYLVSWLTDAAAEF